MVRLIDNPLYLFDGKMLVERAHQLSAEELKGRLAEAGIEAPRGPLPSQSGAGTMARAIIEAHNEEPGGEKLRLHFDKLASHDITYVGVIQTAVACGLDSFPIPYVLTNCHNSLCAVGGTINEDDHLFGLSACRRFGGDYVPAHMAVIHQYMREVMAQGGAMILGTDSHTRYGALGTLAVGEGGPELVKQLLGQSYDMARPKVIAVYLQGSPRPGVGPQDVAIAMISKVFAGGFVKNAALEFVGPGVSSLSVDFRMGIDVMTTETACWSSIWRTDGAVKDFYRIHGRPEAFKQLDPEPVARYDGAVVIDLDRIEPMIALPFHPSNGYTIREFNENAEELLHQVEQSCNDVMDNPELKLDLRSKLKKGRFWVDQGVIAGCAGGTFENAVCAAQILDGGSTGDGEFSLSVYPASQPVYMELVKNGAIASLMGAGATLRTAFCGPCFGAGDTPCNQGFSIRHTTRNFPNREGSKPGSGQVSAVALMDARSIAATAANGGLLTSGLEFGDRLKPVEYHYDASIYAKRVYHGSGKPNPSEELVYGPNIRPWPKIYPLPEHQLLRVASVIHDPVTTTDELIPSGETSSLRSNPLKLAEFTLSRKDPQYVGRAKAAQGLEEERLRLLEKGGAPSAELQSLLDRTGLDDLGTLGLGSLVFARKPGDGSAREQAASSQKMLGGQANVALEYATKRYRSNLMNWGMIPYIVDAALEDQFQVDDWLFVPHIRRAIEEGRDAVEGQLIRGNQKIAVTLKMPDLAAEDRQIILSGCLMNHFAALRKAK